MELTEAYREIIRFSAPQTVTTVAIVPDFGWLLAVVSGALIAFNLRDIVPTHEPLTWSKATRSAGVDLSSPELEVGLVRIGTTKGRLLGKPVLYHQDPSAHDSGACFVHQVSESAIRLKEAD